jgi:uncharacterized protein (TIGR03083 family)
MGAARRYHAAMPRTFARWVEPLARTLARDRADVIAFARSTPPDFWSRASAVDGWTNHDLLAHLAGGNDQLVQTLLRAIATGATLPPSELQPDTDAENARRIEARRSWSVDDLIAYLERDGADMQDLLSRLTDADGELRPEGLGLSVGQFLRIVEHERHDYEHLAQLRSSS